MYIRRKVFSRIWDEETNDEKLFSVNETILSGIDCEDRDFSIIEEPEEKLYGEVKRANKARKRANLVRDSHKLPGGLVERTTLGVSDAIETRNRNIDLSNSIREFDGAKPKSHIQLSPGELSDAARVRAAREQQKGTLGSLKMAAAPNKSKFSFDELADNSNPKVRKIKLDRYKTLKEARKIDEAIKEAEKPVESVTKEVKDAVNNNVGKKGFKLSRNQKIGAAALGTAALVGAGTYAYKKHKKSKEKKD